MTAQLDVEALVGRFDRAARNWGWSSDQADAHTAGYDLAEYAAAKAALLAHIAGEDARVAAAVAGAVEANNKAWATTLDPAPKPYNGPSQVTITPAIHDALYSALLASQTIVELAIRETPSA